MQIENMKKKVTSWSIHHVNKEANQKADDLAKSSILRSLDVLCVYGDNTNE
ncbi:hypothetical protein POUND7_015099 [Theobroma cacao]